MLGPESSYSRGSGSGLRSYTIVKFEKGTIFISVVDPDPTFQIISDPDPIFQIISDPDPITDPT